MLKKITLTAEARLVDAAKAKAQLENTTLKALFRMWLTRYIGAGYRPLMETLRHVAAGRKFSRDEMNRR